MSDCLYINKCLHQQLLLKIKQSFYFNVIVKQHDICKKTNRQQNFVLKSKKKNKCWKINIYASFFTKNLIYYLNIT